MPTGPDKGRDLPEAFAKSGVVAGVTYPVFRGRAPDVLPGALHSGAWLCDGLSVFHDATEAEAPAVRLEISPDGPVFNVADGEIGYLSVSAKLPPSACAAIGPGRVLDVDLSAVASRAVPVYVRLNLDTQPEPVTLHDLVIASDIPRRVTFNFDAVVYPLDDARDGAWVDVIFSKPGGRHIALKDLSLAIRTQGWPTPGL
ncbi:MAG: DUF6478 family protein [Pseudomonadota bacterium]